eukprot:3980739-Prymnesium_polylepis.1
MLAPPAARAIGHYADRPDAPLAAQGAQQDSAIVFRQAGGCQLERSLSRIEECRPFMIMFKR